MSCRKEAREKVVDPSAKISTGKATQEQAVIYPFPNNEINTAFGGQQEIEGEFTEVSLQAYLSSTMPSCLGPNYPSAHSSTCQPDFLYAAEQLAYDAIRYLGVPPQGQEYMALPPMLHQATNNPPIAFQEAYFIHGHGAESNRDTYPFVLPATLTHPHVAAVPTPPQVASATKMNLSQQQALQAHRNMAREHADSTQQALQGFSNQVMTPTLTPYVSQSQSLTTATWAPWWNGTCIAENFFSEAEVNSSITEDKTVTPGLDKPVSDESLQGDGVILEGNIALPGNQTTTSLSLPFNTATLVPTSGMITLEESQAPIQDPFTHLIASIESGQIGEKLDLSGQEFTKTQWKEIADALKKNSSIRHFDFSNSSFGVVALHHIKPIWCRSYRLKLSCHLQEVRPIQCHLQGLKSILPSSSLRCIGDLISIILDENIGYLDIRDCGKVQDETRRGRLVQAICAARKSGKTVLCDPSLDKSLGDGSLQGDVALPRNQTTTSLSLPFNTTMFVPISDVLALKAPQKPIQDSFAHLIASIESGQIGEELDVSGQAFTCHQWNYMATALEGNSSIYRFNFSYSNLGPVALSYIQPALCKPRTRPTSLDLHGLHCDLLSLQHPQRRENLICLILDKKISYLNIQHCGMPGDEMWRKELANAVMEARRMGKTVLCDPSLDKPVADGSLQGVALRRDFAFPGNQTTTSLSLPFNTATLVPTAGVITLEESQAPIQDPFAHLIASIASGDIGEKLDLSRRKFTQTQWQAIAGALKKNDSIHHFDFSDSNFEVVALQCIRPILCRPRVISIQCNFQGVSNLLSALDFDSINDLIRIILDKNIAYLDIQDCGDVQDETRRGKFVQAICAARKGGKTVLCDPSLDKPVADESLQGDGVILEGNIALSGNQTTTSLSLPFNTAMLVPTADVITLEESQGPIQDPFTHLIASIASGDIGETLDLSGQKFTHIQWQAIADALKKNSSIYHFDFSYSSFGEAALQCIRPILCKSRVVPAQCNFQWVNPMLSSSSLLCINDLIRIIVDKNIAYLDIRDCGEVQDEAWKKAFVEAICAARKGGKTVLCDPSLDKPVADESLQGDVALPRNQTTTSLSLPFNTTMFVPTSGVITLEGPQKHIQDPFTHFIAYITSGDIGETLDLSGQKFTKIQWKAIAAALKKNNSIYRFNFSDSNFGPLALCYIQPALCKPRTRPISLDLHGLDCDLLSLQQPQRRKNLICLILDKKISYLNIQHCGMPGDEMWRKELANAVMEARRIGKTVLCDPSLDKPVADESLQGDGVILEGNIALSGNQTTTSLSLPFNTAMLVPTADVITLEESQGPIQDPFTHLIASIASGDIGETLDLSGQKFTNIQWQAIADALKKNNNIYRFNFSDGNFGVVAFQCIRPILCKSRVIPVQCNFQGLKHILSSSSVGCINDLIRIILDTNIIYVNIRNCGEAQDEAWKGALVQAICAARKGGKTVLCDPSLDKPVADESLQGDVALPGNQTTTSLSLLFNTATLVPTADVITLEESQGPIQDPFTHLIASIASGDIGETLDLSGQKFTNIQWQAIAAALKKNNSIHHFDFSNSSFGVVALRCIKPILCKSRFISIQCNFQGLKHILSSSSVGCINDLIRIILDTNIIYVNIRNCGEAQDEAWKKALLEAICAARKGGKTVLCDPSLDTPVSDESLQGDGVILEGNIALSGNQTTTSPSLLFNTATLVPTADVITLEESQGPIQDPFTHLIASIASGDIGETLDLSGQKFTNIQWKKIAAALKKNNSIYRFNFSDSNFGVVALQFIRPILCKSRVIPVQCNFQKVSNLLPALDHDSIKDLIRIILDTDIIYVDIRNCGKIQGESWKGELVEAIWAARKVGKTVLCDPSLDKPVADGSLQGDGVILEGNIALPGNQTATSLSLPFSTATLVPTSGVITLEGPQKPIQDLFTHLIASITSGDIGETLDLSGQKFTKIQWQAIAAALKKNNIICRFDFSYSSFGVVALQCIRPILCKPRVISIQCNLQGISNLLSAVDHDSINDLIQIILDTDITYLDIRNCGEVRGEAWKGELVEAIWVARKGGKTVLCDPSLDTSIADESLQGDGVILEGNIALPGNQTATSPSLPFNTETLVPTSDVITLEEPQGPIQDPFTHLIASIASGDIGETLDLSGQKFTKIQWQAIAAALKKNNSIYRFNFSDSNLGPLALCYIQPALCKPRTRPISLDLHELGCDLLSLRQPQRRKKLILLVLNKNISYLNIQHCGIPRNEMWRKVLVNAIMKARSMGKTVLCDDVEIFQTPLNPIEVPVSDRLVHEGLFSSKRTLQALKTSSDDETPPSKKKRRSHDL